MNAETYYLSQIVVELSQNPESERDVVLRRHPRWNDLCEEYGEPRIPRTTNPYGLDPNSLAARLITITFAYGSKSWTEDIPQSFNIYSLLGVVGKSLNEKPLKLRLIWESGEEDSTRGLDGPRFDGPDWWDSSDDEATHESDGNKRLTKEVELLAGTRSLGTYIEGKTANIRVESKPHML